VVGKPIPGSDAWLSPDPNVIVTGGRLFSLYDVATGTEVQRLHTLQDRQATSAGFSPDGRHLAVEFCERDRCYPLVGICDWTSRCLLRIYETTSENECHDIALSADRRFAVCTNGYIRAFGPDHAEQIGRSFYCLATSLRFSGDDLEAVWYDGRVVWVDPLTGRALREAAPPAGRHVTGCAVSGVRLAAGVAGRAVLVWQLPRWEEAEPA
jgi:hypothetical protein